MKHAVIRTDTADAGIRKIILYIAQNFGNTAALEKLDEIEKRILELGDDPYIGTEPRYLILKRQGYKVLILEKDLVFYKIHEENKQVIVYAVVDQRQKRCPEDISFFYVQALMDKKLHRMKVTTISEVYHAVISTAFKCRGRK